MDGCSDSDASIIFLSRTEEMSEAEGTDVTVDGKDRP